MPRLPLPFAAGLIAIAVAAPSRAQTPAELIQSARYVARFQNPDGGFASSVGGKSSLNATTSAVRALKYTGGSIPDVSKCIDYVRSCFDKASGGFAATPGGTPDVAVTALALGAVVELKIDPAPFAKPATEFIAANAKTFEQIRIGVSGFEVLKLTHPVFEAWTKEILATRNPDGSFGQGPTRAKETGGKGAALARMGVKIENKEGLVKALRDEQQAGGGWSGDGAKPDLGTTYRIMRCLFMLKEKPALDSLRTYVASHRQSDGGYASTPGGPADLGGTYSCSIILYWARLLDGEPAITESVGFVPLFDGKSLDGWEGDAAIWSAKSGQIYGDSPGLKHNDFLASKAGFGDFILKLNFRVEGDATANSGVQFRSVRVPGHEMSGYQADVGQGYWGCLYDESRRNKVLMQASPKAIESVRKDGWNQYVIRAMGDHITLSLNGATSVDYREPDPAIAREGKVALQVHAGNKLAVTFKDILIQTLPVPKADDASTPGFHLRTVDAPDGPRKYAVYLPVGYDPKKAYPAVLFLHGSGERGDDGVTSAQIGLGAAILQHPDDFPAIAVFPQARRTWAADSDDARAALLALDAVMKAHKVDKDRVALTGLSMGGAGTWGLAATEPGRWSAIVPICGRGRPESAGAIKGIPTWIVCGDEDGLPTVQNSRAMQAAVVAAGGSARYTEYRSVGHNSWDRAYNDLALLDWMLGQSRKGRSTTNGD